jgi:hypothetical protein
MYFVIGHPMVVIQEQIDIAVDIGQIVDPSGNSRPTAMSPTPPRKRPRRRSPSSCPNAKHTANTDSGHEIHKEPPQLVNNSIREVVDVVRSGSWQPAP